MSQLLEIRTKIESTTVRIVELERALRDYPDLPSVAANLESAVRLRTKLEQQFMEAAGKAGYDIYRYRGFEEGSGSV